MRQIRLTSSSLLCLVSCFVVLSLTSSASAGPPKIGDNSGSSWSGGLWPSSWKLPSSSSSSRKSSDSIFSEPDFVKATRSGMTRTWRGVQRSTRTAWDKTKYALRPYDAPQQKPRNTSSQAPPEGGFWSNLFGSTDTPQPEATVNDFLRQPMPQ